MKKLLLVALVLVLCLSAALALAEVDAYSSASLTKTVLDETAAKEAVTLLSEYDSDLTTLAGTKVEGYARPEKASMAQIMTVNADESIGLSTITEWQVNESEDGIGTVHMQLTYGQNAINLFNNVGTGATLLINVDGTYYLLHLVVTEATEQVYSEEAFNNGEFNQFYSGAENGFSSYDIYADITTVETSNALIFGTLAGF